MRHAITVSRGAVERNGRCISRTTVVAWITSLLMSSAASGGLSANGSRVCDDSRVALEAIDTSHTLTDNNDKLIFAAGVNDDTDCRLRNGEGGHTLQYRVLAGSWANVPTSNVSGPFLASSGTVLVDNSTVSSGERRANLSGTGSYRTTAREFTSSTNLDYSSDCEQDHTEGQWALDFSTSPVSTTYEFRVRWGTKDCGNQYITYAAQITTSSGGGGGTEDFEYLSTPEDVTPSAGSWQDVDVSAHVPVGATGVMLQEVNPDGDRYDYGVRRNGSSDAWMLPNQSSRHESWGFHMVGLDSNRIFECYTESTLVRTYLLGYTMDGATYFTNGIDVSPGSSGSWTDIDISAYTGGDTAIGAIVAFKETDRDDYPLAVRKKGSTDNFYSDVDKGDGQTLMIGVDANEIFQAKIGHTSIDLYLVGYVTSGAVFFTNAIDKQTSTTGSYVDVDITSHIGSDDATGALTYFLSSTEDWLAVRPNGATHDYYGRIIESTWPVVGIDSNDIFEQKIGATSYDLKLMGYTLIGGSPASPPTISSGASQSFLVNSAATSISQITITDPGGVITAANDIRIRIPAGFGMTWDSSDTTAAIGGAASSKVSTTVSYEDGNATLVLNVTGNFVAADVITVSGLSFANFTAISSANSLDLEAYNDSAVTAVDDKTLTITGPNYRSIGTASGTLYSTGTASTAAGSDVVTFAGGAVLPANVGAGDKLTIGSSPVTLFSDTFSDGSTSGWTRWGDIMHDGGGVFRNSCCNADAHYSIDAGAAWTDYTYSIDHYADDDDVSGITFRIQDSNNFYLLTHGFGDNDGWNLRLSKVVGGSQSDLIAPINNQGGAAGQVNSADVWYEFKVELSGTNIKVYVDNVLKYDINDSTYASGTAGVWMEGQTAQCRFDNALVVSGGATAESYVLSRDSDTQVTLQSAAGSTLTNQSYTIERAYNTLQAWEDDRDGDLVGEGRREAGVCYNDGAFTDRVVISGSSTNAMYYMALTVPINQRHDGVADSGARIDAVGGWTSQDAITIEDEYTRIEWLEITDVFDAGDGISFADSPSSDNSTATGVFVHGFWQNNNAAFRVAADNITLRNCWATGGTTYGVQVAATGSAMVENCTLWGFSGGGYGVHGAANSTVSIRNTISVDHGNVDMYIETGGGATIPYFGYNMFSTYGGGFVPSAYAGNNQWPPADLDHLFVDTSTNDLHLQPSGNRAGNTGLDLSSDFSDDIDGATRTAAWDMGADEARTGTTIATPKVLSWSEVER